jgi:hypothetical protein
LEIGEHIRFAKVLTQAFGHRHSQSVENRWTLAQRSKGAGSRYCGI